MEANQKGNATQNTKQPQASVMPPRSTTTPIAASRPAALSAPVHVSTPDRVLSPNPVMAPGSALVQKSALESPQTPSTKTEEPNMMKQGVSAKKKGKGAVLGMILLGILAVGGISFGIWEMLEVNTQKEQLNSQINILKQQNNELQDKLSEADDGIAVVDADIDDSSVLNPVITSNNAEQSFITSFISTAIGDGGKALHVNIKDGAIESCDIVGGDATTTCEITGLNGEVYKVIEFGRGQDKTMNKLGFIMNDGTVWYLSLSDAINNGNFNIQGSLKLNGFVTDAIRIQVVGTSSGHFSTIFVMSDGSTVELDESML